jgi:glutamate dehydrogenase (NADP+)
LIRPEATGYGAVYFLNEMLIRSGKSFDGKVVAVSGSGNVAQFAIEKITQLGGKAVSASDSSGCIYDPAGIDADKLAFLMELKNVKRGRIKEYADKYNVKFFEGKRPWEVIEKVDMAMPCATQNELNEENAKQLIAAGVYAVAEGANMPSTPEAVHTFAANGIMFAPGKASNAGGVATSGLEMSQNSLRLSWTSEEVDGRLHDIMKNIHASCVKYGTNADGTVDYVKGANIAGFVKVAEAMIAQGVV